MGDEGNPFLKDRDKPKVPNNIHMQRTFVFGSLAVSKSKIWSGEVKGGEMIRGARLIPVIKFFCFCLYLILSRRGPPFAGVPPPPIVL